MRIAALALAVALIVSSFPAAAGIQSNPNAQEILAAMDRTYAEAESYRDSGVINETFFSSISGIRSHETKFSTAYDRPTARYRYEFRDDNANTTERETRYIVWQDLDATDLQLWRSSHGNKPRVERPESLIMALGAAAGVGSLSSYDIPVLLFRNRWGSRDTRWGVSGFTLRGMSNAQRIDDATLDGKDMYRITGMILETAMTVWIDKETFLVRRIDRKRKLPGNVRVDSTTTYSPVINAAIPKELLIFNRPK